MKLSDIYLKYYIFLPLCIVKYNFKIIVYFNWNYYSRLHYYLRLHHYYFVASPVTTIRGAPLFKGNHCSRKYGNFLNAFCKCNGTRIRVTLLIHEIFVYRVLCIVYFNTRNYIHDNLQNNTRQYTIKTRIHDST